MTVLADNPELPDTTALSPRERALAELLASPALDRDRFAILITDLETGEELAAFADDRPLIPASIQKCVTTASLLRDKGPSWRYETDVFFDGRIHKGVLEGNIIVVGACDPSLNSRKAPESPEFVAQIVNALRAEGVDSIAGRIVVDESDFAGPSTPPSWASGDLRHAYGTGSHALNFENNASGDAAIQNPAGVFETRLKNALARARISLGDNELHSGRRRSLVKHESAPLEDIMRSCMMRSDNLYAESLLRTFGHVKGRDGSTTTAASLEADTWRRLGAPMEGVVIVDGSGLSRSNRMTARFLTYLLTEMADDVEYASFFPLAGQEGTLRKFMHGTRLDSYLALKTGSMSGIQSYAGYLLDEDFAPTHTVVIIANALPKGRADYRAALSDFLLKTLP